MTFVVVPESHAMRSAVEDAIRTPYRHRYGARLASFPDVVVAEATMWGAIECAAGIRLDFAQGLSGGRQQTRP
jgi:hypothetical protein